MAPPSEKLAGSLEVLHRLQADGRRVFKSREFTRVHRERLLRHGFLRRIIKGWAMSSHPGTSPADTTPWYASFWEFCARYASDRFGDEWHLSPELTLLIHAGATAIPRQVVIYTPRGTNNAIELPFDTSLYDLLSSPLPSAGETLEREGLRLFTPAAALTRVPESFFVRHPVEAQVVLGMILDASEVLRPLLAGGHPTVAGRVAGAFRRAGRSEVADEILDTMGAAGFDVREADPFAPEQHGLGTIHLRRAPMVRRLEGLWRAMRQPIVHAFSTPPGRPGDPDAYLAQVDEAYRNDAYHSLSIEGYAVTPELVERVRRGNWDSKQRREDRDERDALAARGYWQAFQVVKDSVADVLRDADPGGVVRAHHRVWYRELFQPFVAAGVLDASALAGYRHNSVYLAGSRHVPPQADTVRDAMPALFDLIEGEHEPAVRAVLGHWLVGYIHPYPDGNGRIARFLMNVMLASGGYPWTVIRVGDRQEYLNALEVASVESDIEPFAHFIAARVPGTGGPRT